MLGLYARDFDDFIRCWIVPKTHASRRWRSLSKWVKLRYNLQSIYYSVRSPKELILLHCISSTLRLESEPFLKAKVLGIISHGHPSAFLFLYYLLCPIVRHGLLCIFALYCSAFRQRSLLSIMKHVGIFRRCRLLSTLIFLPRNYCSNNSIAHLLNDCWHRRLSWLYRRVAFCLTFWWLENLWQSTTAPATLLNEPSSVF